MGKRDPMVRILSFAGLSLFGSVLKAGVIGIHVGSRGQIKRQEAKLNKIAKREAKLLRTANKARSLKTSLPKSARSALVSCPNPALPPPLPVLGIPASVEADSISALKTLGVSSSQARVLLNKVKPSVSSNVTVEQLVLAMLRCL